MSRIVTKYHMYNLTQARRSEYWRQTLAISEDKLQLVGHSHTNRCTQLLLHENVRRNDCRDSEERALCTMDVMELTMERAMAAFTSPRRGAPLFCTGLTAALLNAPYLAAIVNTANKLRN